MQIAAAALLIVGVQLWLIVGHGIWGRNYSLWVIAGAFIVAAIPPINSRIARALDRLRNPSATTRRIVAVVIALLATGYFVLTARQQGIDLVPRIHDESSYLIQTRMILAGRLWEPQHPQADFFETIHVIVKPVYASKYFPGAALLYAPGLAVGLPYWLLPALAAGAVVGLVYRIVAEMADGVAGLLAALMMIGCSSLRRVSVMYLATTPLMMLVLLALWAFLHWRRQRRPGWAAAVGFFMSWAAITRPLDAVCFAIPIALAVVWELWRLNFRVWFMTLGALFLAGVPMIAIQLVANIGITGNLAQTPWSLYTQHDDPFDGMAIGAINFSQKSESRLPQKVEFSEGFTKGAAIERRAPGRIARFFKDDLPADANVMLPHPLLLVLLPVGLLAARGRGRGVLLATIPLCLFAYALYTFSVPNYLVIATPVCALLVVLSIDALSMNWPRMRGFFTTFLSISITGVVCTQLPQLNRFVLDDMFRPADPKGIAQRLANLPHTPAVVLFRYAPGKDNPHIEPVYNTDVAWPDDAPVIRAHDLGPRRNIEIFRYYPERAFYSCDPRFSEPRFLGYGKYLVTGSSGL